MDIDQLREVFRTIRRAPADEIDLHEQMEVCLDRAGVLHEREVVTKSGPVDFVIEGAWAMEVKVQGSGLAVARQIIRYLTDDRFAVGVIVTTKAMRVPITMTNGKPIHVIELWRNFI